MATLTLNNRRLPGQNMFAPIMPPPPFPGEEGPATNLNDPSMAIQPDSAPPPPIAPPLDNQNDNGPANKLDNAEPGIMPPPPPPKSNPDIKMAPEAGMPPPPMPEEVKPVTANAQNNLSAMAPPPPKPVTRIDSLLSQKKELESTAPKMGKPSIWGLLGSAAIGGLAGYSNAAGRSRYIDPSSAEGFVKHPKYSLEKAQYDQKMGAIDNQIAQTEKLDDLQSRQSDRAAEAQQRIAKAGQLTEDAATRASNEKRKEQDDLLTAAKQGWKPLIAGAPPPPGYVPGTLHGQTFAVPTDETVGQKNWVTVPPDMAKQLGITDKKVAPQVLQTYAAMYKVDNKPEPKASTPKTETELAIAVNDPNTPPEMKAAYRSALKDVSKQKAADRPVTNNNISLSPDTIAMFAESTRTTGQLPSVRALGQGNVTAIANAAGQGGGTNLAANRANFGADSSTLKKLQATQSSLNQSYGTIQNHFNILRDLSSKVDRTGSPLVNKYLLYAKGQIAGDPDTQVFENAIGSTANEYARFMNSVTGGGVSTDSARAEAHSMLKGAMSNGTLGKVLENMQAEMSGKKSNFQQELDRVRGGVGKSHDAIDSAPAQPQQPTHQPTSYANTATGKDGHKIGTNDGGKSWFDVQTGQPVK